MPTTRQNKQAFSGSQAPTDSAQVLRRFRVIFNAVRGHFLAVEKKVGLGGAPVWALGVVRDKPDIGLGELARCMDIHQSTASNLIKTLVRRNLISVTKAPLDRRNVQLHILPEGLTLLAKVSGPFEGVLPQALAKLHPATVQRLDRDLQELIGLLKADETAAGLPLGELSSMATGRAETESPH